MPATLSAINQMEAGRLGGCRDEAGRGCMRGVVRGGIRADEAHAVLGNEPRRRKCRAPPRAPGDLTPGPRWRWWNRPRMTAPLLSAPPAMCVLLAFNASN